VTVIDGASNQVVATVVTGNEPGGLCYNWLNNKVYCANESANTVTVIDGATNQVIATVAAGAGPCALEYSPDHNKVYCADWAGSTVTVIDGANDRVLRTITVGTWPCAFAWQPARNRMYVANSQFEHVSVLRDSALEIEERAPMVERRVALEFRPNPFRDRVSFQLTANGLRSEVRIYDVSGALVRDFGATRSARAGTEACPYDLTWDGTDDMGRRLPNGVYLVWVSDGSRTVAARELILARE